MTDTHPKFNFVICLSYCFLKPLPYAPSVLLDGCYVIGPIDCHSLFSVRLGTVLQQSLSGQTIGGDEQICYQPFGYTKQTLFMKWTKQADRIYSNGYFPCFFYINIFIFIPFTTMFLAAMSDCHFRIWTQRVIWDTSDIWSE